MKLLTNDNRKKENNLKTITFRLEHDLIDNFKTLCKKHKIKQATVIRNALRLAIEEMEKIENEK